MAKKAVYNNQYLAIYITQDDFKALLRGGSVEVRAQIGKDKADQGGVVVSLLPKAKACLKDALLFERQAQATVRKEFKKANPNYKTYAERKGLKKHAK